MPRKKKGSEAPDLFDDLMGDLEKEDSGAVDSSEETSGKALTGVFDFGRPDAARERDLKKGNMTSIEASIAVSGSGASQMWDQLKGGKASREAAVDEIPDQHEDESTVAVAVSDKTIAVGAQAQQQQPLFVANEPETSTKYESREEKFVLPTSSYEKEFKAHINPDASLAQAQALQIAQDKILSLEKEVDRLRQENDDLASAAEIMRQRSEEFQSRIERLEREKVDIYEQGQSEITLLKGQMAFKDSELSKARQKTEDLESRLHMDFKKIRVKERELENRLEIVKAEKQALLRAKDEQILELQRKMDHLKSELDHHRTKVQDMFKSMEQKKEQMRKTVKALRLALTHLEAQSDDLATDRKRE